ncbi:MAG TPA: DUF1667 domain-containing protein [Eubacteriales bacterium]|jgi:CxxC motif-containing protein|nr:DUF1667 domain-containing protein [Clostridia bacterium]HRR89337.1 DUF1667 domain-containing protein [Eubacteriales bacterium]HRU84937.1 DUF1667 domain-containing protein [Eubacteriales bacterium]
MEFKTICIRCPAGCPLTVTGEAGKYVVGGNTCKRGESYALSEMLSPERTVTSLAAVEDGSVVPVKSSRPIAKDKVFAVLKELKKFRAKLPVEQGQVLIANVLGTGADIIATDSGKRRAG